MNTQTAEKLLREGFKESLANYLSKVSEEICQTNECTDDDHKCESYAYILAHEPDNFDRIELLDVCMPDYFQGYSLSEGQTVIALPLPFEGGAAELEAELLRNAD